MDTQFTMAGALIGLVLAIFLIVKKVQPVYSLVLGALVGGLIGGGNLIQTVETMVNGAQSMISSVLRILTSGVLVGALIQTGSTDRIAKTIVEIFGEKKAIIAIAIATMVICGIGVFIPIAVIAVAPIALAIGRKANLTKPAIFLALVGGGKAGNIISPNPNTIAVAEVFDLNLTSLMAKNLIPALCALVVTILLATLMGKRKTGFDISLDEEESAVNREEELPSFWAAIAGPIVVLVLLILRPVAGIDIDPLAALPVGGVVCVLVTGRVKSVLPALELGMSKVVGVCMLMLSTGTLAGIIQASTLQDNMILVMKTLHMPVFLLAPLSGILLAAATASTTAGATIASQTFSSALLQAGVPAIEGGAMINAGATVIDSMPHGSFFHASVGAVNMSMKDGIKILAWEACIGLTSTVAAVVIYLIG